MFQSLVNVEQRRRRRRRRPDREGQAMCLIDLVIRILPKDHYLDRMQGGMSRPESVDVSV